MTSQLTPIAEKRLLIVLLIAFALVAAIYSIAAPPFEMSDEMWHYPMVKTLADGNGLPIQDPQNPGPWKQEGSQPPLYYYLAAAATTWIDTSDVVHVLRPNPHVDNGVITPDGNNNLIAHNYEREKWPWRGTVLAVHIARFLSVIFGAGAVYFTYRIGLEVFPDRRWLALAGAAAVAFTPMFAFISGAVNNDSLSVMLAASALWIMMVIVRHADTGKPTLRPAAALGVTLGLAALTKTSTLGLFGLAGLSMAYAAWRARRWQTFMIEGPLIISLAAIIAGWWYLRNVRLYGDPLGLSAFIAILGQRQRPASLLQLWGERFGFMQSYWGLFGGVNIPMPAWTYVVLNALAVLSLIGAAVVLIQKLRRDGWDLSRWMPTLLSLLWIAGVVLPLALSWARITWSSQGRLVFAAISCISLWFIAGLSAPLPQRWGIAVAGAVLSLMAILTFASPFAWIAPRYKLPQEVITEGGANTPVEFAPPGAEQPVIRLIDYRVSPEVTHPGDGVRVTLTWESLSPMDRNWSTFIHLEDSASLLAGQRDLYPGLGLIATTDLPAGFRWQDEIVVPVQDSAYTPETLSVKVGLYDYSTCPALCERMQTANGQSAVTLGEIDLLAKAGDEIPNPVSFDFGRELELVGYVLEPRNVRPGGEFTLTLYWRGLRSMSRNYTVSVQLLGPETRIFAQKDSWPLDGALPTSAWTPGELVTDPYRLRVNPDTPPGVYDIQVVVYSADDTGVIERLQRVMADGRLVDDFVLLTRLRVIQ
jgi:4-amino-4-deoxy-L-arabinose transferase-like glycosyltransferase